MEAVTAIEVREFGPPEVLEPSRLTAPVPGPDGLVIDVEWAGVTFVETQVRAGRPPHPSMAPSLPWVPGNGVAGRVGRRRVVSTTGGAGGYAGQVAVPAAEPLDVPAELELDAALALLADGRTAVGLMRTARPARGETAVVLAAAGGVGSLLVQLAHNAGTRVVAAAGGARKLALARELGADAAFDYHRPGWAERVRAEEGAVDVVFDGVGGQLGSEAFELLGPGGRHCSFGMAAGSFTAVSEAQARERGVRLVRGSGATPETSRELSRAALRLAASGRLRPLIGQTFPLERAAEAHAAIEARQTVGKTLLKVAA